MKGPTIPCPFCGETLNVRAFINAKRPGFVFECWGNEALPHVAKMYLSDFRGDFLTARETAPTAPRTPGRKERAAALLERAGKALRGGTE